MECVMSNIIDSIICRKITSIFYRVLLVSLLLSQFFVSPALAALIDRGGGLIYDTVLDVTWLQDANYGAGPVAFFKVLDDWRADGTMQGLEIF